MPRRRRHLCLAGAVRGNEDGDLEFFFVVDSGDICMNVETPPNDVVSIGIIGRFFIRGDSEKHGDGYAVCFFLDSSRVYGSIHLPEFDVIGSRVTVTCTPHFFAGRPAVDTSESKQYRFFGKGF